MRFIKALFVLMLLSSAISNAQVVCIKCFDQTPAISPLATNMILNPSFEINTCTGGFGQFCPASGSYSCDLTNWTCTGGGPSTYAQIFSSTFGVVIPDGTTAAYLGNFFCKPCSAITDDTSCIVHVDCTLQGVPAGYPTNDPQYGNNTGVHLKQTVGGLVVGNVYVLEFWAGGEGPGFYNEGLFGLDLGFGPIMLKCDESIVSQGDLGNRYYIEFKPTSTSHTIEFINWGHICSTCTEVVLDDVKLYPISQLSSNMTPCSPLDTVNYFTLDTTICEQSSVTYLGKTYNQSGTYKDSIIHTPTNREYYTLNLTVVQCVFPTSFDTTICDGKSYTYNGRTYTQTGTYKDTIIQGPFHIDVHTINLTVDPCYDLFVPSAFTPNGDLVNPTFKPIGKNFNPDTYSMSVFDRWGTKIFTTKDLSKGWNGTYKGNPCEVGTYYYLIEFKFNNADKSEQRKGDVTLIR